MFQIGQLESKKSQDLPFQYGVLSFRKPTGAVNTGLVYRMKLSNRVNFGYLLARSRKVISILERMVVFDHIQQIDCCQPCIPDGIKFADFKEIIDGHSYGSSNLVDFNTLYQLISTFGAALLDHHRPRVSERYPRDVRMS